MSVEIEVELMGVLQETASKKNVSLELSTPVSVNDVIFELANRFPSEFKRALIDPELNDPRPNVLILLNKREISVLDGLETKVENGDKIVLIPVSHGG